VPAFTATSGPGLSLMAESIGLAVASETPLVVLNVMRGGPSTGIPTKSEQGDLNLALYGTHGDAPHLVLAPLDIADCAFTTGWAVRLAQRLQTPAIVLSDQYLGQSSAVVSPPRTAEPAPQHRPPPDPAQYLRYRLTASGISDLSIPGDPGSRFTADGLEHNERGTPSASQSDHSRQLDKRLHKLEQFQFGPDWGRVEGQGEVALVAFGSAAAALAEAAALLRDSGIAARTVALRLLAPLPAADLERALAGCRAALVVEQNHGAQLYHYLRGREVLPGIARSFARPGPVPLDPEAIAAATLEVIAA
jgi:2-oxoglutarate ferredoxin oxidoreductase subunit alpha